MEYRDLFRAYKESGYIITKWTPSNIRYLLKSSNLNKAVRHIMLQKNITLSRLIDKLDSLLDAPHPFAKDGHGNPMPDNLIQQRAFQDGMKLWGGYPIPVQKVDVHKTQEYHISLEDQKKAEETLAECIDAEVIEDANGDREGSDDPAARPFN